MENSRYDGGVGRPTGTKTDELSQAVEKATRSEQSPKDKGAVNGFEDPLAGPLFAFLPSNGMTTVNVQTLRQCECELCQSISGMRQRERNIQRAWVPPVSPEADLTCNGVIPTENVSSHGVSSSQVDTVEADEDLMLAIEQSMVMNGVSSSDGDDMENYFAENYYRVANGHGTPHSASLPATPNNETELVETGAVYSRPQSLVDHGVVVFERGIPLSQSDSSGHGSLHPSTSTNTVGTKRSRGSDYDSDDGLYILPDDVVQETKPKLNDSFEDHGDFIEADMPGNQFSSADSSNHASAGPSTSSSYEDLQEREANLKAVVQQAQVQAHAQAVSDLEESFTKLVFNGDTDSDSYVDMRYTATPASSAHAPVSTPLHTTACVTRNIVGATPSFSTGGISRPTELGPLRPALPHTYNPVMSYVAPSVHSFPLSDSTPSSSPYTFASPPYSDNSAMYGMLSGSSICLTPDMDNSECSSGCPVSAGASSRHRSTSMLTECTGEPLRAARSSGDVRSCSAVYHLPSARSDPHTNFMSPSLRSNCQCSRLQARCAAARNCTSCVCSVLYYFPRSDQETYHRPRPPIRSLLLSGQGQNHDRSHSLPPLSHSPGDKEKQDKRVCVTSGALGQSGKCACLCHQAQLVSCQMCREIKCPLVKEPPQDNDRGLPQGSPVKKPPKNTDETQENQNNINIENGNGSVPSRLPRSVREQLWQNIWSRKQLQLLPLVLDSVCDSNSLDAKTFIDLLRQDGREEEDSEDDGYVDFNNLVKEFMVRQLIENYTTEVHSSKCSWHEELDPVMVWTEYQAYQLQVQQLGVSSCGPTALCNVLRALNYMTISTDTVCKAVRVSLRTDSSPAPEYLLSRAVAGTDAIELLQGAERLTGGEVTGRFFPFYPARKVCLLQWLAHWMNKGAVPLATLNPQVWQPPWKPLPDAWHHQMIFGVDNHGIYVTNPLEILPEFVFSSWLCSDSVLLIRRKDITDRWTANCDLSIFMRQPDLRWSTLNVLGQTVNTLREDTVYFPLPHLTTHVTIPAKYESGITLYVRSESEVYKELMQAPELPFLHSDWPT